LRHQAAIRPLKKNVVGGKIILGVLREREIEANLRVHLIPSNPSSLEKE